MSHPHDKPRILYIWILLGSHLTVDVFSKQKLLINICDVMQSLTPDCNAGTLIVTNKRDLKGKTIVCYCPMGIANIFSTSKK